MSYTTETLSGRNRMEYTFDQGINLAKFPQTEVYPKATVVKINTTTGKLDAAVTGADVQFGVIVVPQRKVDECPTVITGFSSIIVAKAGAILVPGDKVVLNGYDSTDKISKVNKATTGVVSGLALEAAAANAEVRIGLFLSPVTVPAP